MSINKSAGLVLVGLLFALSGTLLRGQDHQVAGKKLNRTPITYTDAVNGQQMYKQYCAACHGLDGKGMGPAVEYLRNAPPDLTTLKQRNHGKYPDLKVKCRLLFGANHEEGVLAMPEWSSRFRDLSPNTIKLRAYNLTSYVESLQQN